jgi:hypothetical protein
MRGGIAGRGGGAQGALLALNAGGSPQSSDLDK